MRYRYKDKIVEKADKLTLVVYKLSMSAPKHELYGFISQLQRAALSVVLNMIEGTLG
jgi:four helix bundle protein